MLEAVQGRIQRPLLDAQQIIGNLLDALRDCPPVHWLEGNRPEDQQVKGPLQDVCLVAHVVSLVD